MWTLQRTSPVRARTEDNAECHSKPAGRLHKHHRDAEGTHKPHVVGMPDLRRVLEQHEDPGRNPEKCSPKFELFGTSGAVGGVGRR